MSAATMAEIHQTRAARKDILYRGWLSEMNYIALMNTGTGIYQHSGLTPAKLRRWYLSGMTAYDAVKKSQVTR